MFSESILSYLCAAAISKGDVAHVGVWSDGQCGIARNGQAVGEERWPRHEVDQCAKAFLHYVRLLRKRLMPKDAPVPAM